MFIHNNINFPVQYDYITDCTATVWETLGPNQPITAYHMQIGTEFNNKGLLVSTNRQFRAHTASGIPYQVSLHFIIADEIVISIVPDTRIKKRHYRDIKVSMRAAYMFYGVLICVGGKRLQMRVVTL